MALLFVDTTYDTTLGLLSDDFRWIEFQTHSGQKASSVLQIETQKLCSEHKIRPRELKGIITVAGPGFYTGLRLSEGFADIFKFFGIPTYSLYSHEIPKACGIAAGAWVTKAYRGEHFVYKWNGEANEKALVTEEPQLENAFTATATVELIRKHPEVLREVVASNQQRESYYFRAPEDEYRTADK